MGCVLGLVLGEKTLGNLCWEHFKVLFFTDMMVIL